MGRGLRLFKPGAWRGHFPPRGLEWSRSFRAHEPGLGEFLEEWYDRSAESCDRFDNISEVNKYSLCCTECRYFDGGCAAQDSQGPNILNLLKASYKHDGLAWEGSQNAP